MAEYTRMLAELVANTTYEDLPEEVVDRAKTIMMDTLSCAVAGYTKAPEECGWIIRIAKELGGGPESTVWMDGTRLSAMAAAMANACMVHTIDYDDTHLESVAHLGSSLLGAVMALGEKRHATGKEILTAFVLGFEVAARVGNSVNKGAVHRHYKYWHPTATAGTIGCAAACAKLMGFDAAQTEMAIGLGIDQAAGFRYCIDKGDFSKSLHPAWSAMRGIMAAQIIAVGGNVPKGLLEYPTGFCAAMCDQPVMEYLDEDLGKTWAVMKDALKMYPSIHGSHSGIEATINIVTEQDLKPEEIANIHIRLSPLAKGQGINYEPANVLAARLSMPCCMAIAAIKRRVTLDDFTEELIHDPDFLAYMKKVTIEPWPEFNEQFPDSGFTSEAAITTTDGRVFTCLVPYCKAHPERPATEQDIREKYFMLANITWPPEKSERIYAAFRQLESCGDIGDLVAAMQS